MARKQPEKIYTDAYETNSQRVSKDGKVVIMSNGRSFKRTVLPSVADGVKKISEQLEDIEDIESSDN